MATKTGWAAYPCINPKHNGRFIVDSAEKFGTSVTIHPQGFIQPFIMPEGGVFFEDPADDKGYFNAAHNAAIAHAEKVNK